MNKIERFAAWSRRVEPQWYIGWAVGTGVTAVTFGTPWVMPVAYLLMAGLASQRNQAATIASEWVNRAEQWSDLAGTWKALYEHERDKHGR